MALGTVGGLTGLHPMAKLSLEMLQKPSANRLMEIVAAAGLAQNFAALRALTTKGTALVCSQLAPRIPKSVCSCMIP